LISCFLLQKRVRKVLLYPFKENIAAKGSVITQKTNEVTEVAHQTLEISERPDLK
jgi:hypothetical protein